MIAKWKFPAQKSGLTDYHSIPTEEALDSDLETFVREVLQNANDQGLGNGEPARVTFEFTELTDDLDDFLKSLNWDNDDTPDNLRWHLERAIDNDQARDPGLKRFIDNFERDRLLVLTIHDENTTGLNGSETDNSQPYGALVKDFGGSEKPDSSAGGSYGVGKTVLWAFSSMSTVLFNSHPTDSPAEHTPPRLIGRSILPAHEHESEHETYTNHGWFGYDDPNAIDRLGRQPSIWNDDGEGSELADALHVGRGDREEGTSIAVVGFRVPGEDLHPDVKELAEDFRHAAAKHFWPAISCGDLEVVVETPAGETTVSWNDAPGVAPFVKCYEELFTTEETELSGPGSIAKTDVEIAVPRENDETVDDPDSSYETATDLIARQLAPADVEQFDDSSDSDLAKNHVARLRGAQMIVNYVDASSVAERGDDFAAILAAGEAQTPDGETPTDEQVALEKFLRRSEPTQHDDWVGKNNDYLKKYYTGTIVKEVEGLGGERLETAIAELVQESIEPGDDVPDTDDIAPVMDGRSGPDGNGNGSPMEWERRPSATFDGTKWSFSGIGGPDGEHGEWSLKIELTRLDIESSSSGDIDIDSVTPMTGGVKVIDDGTSKVLEIPESVDTVEFEGESTDMELDGRDPEEAFEVGDITEARLDVSAEIADGGED